MLAGIIKDKSRDAYSRIILNRATAAFFIFSFVLCLAQGIIQSFLFSIDSEYKNLLHNIILATEPEMMFKNITYIQGGVQTKRLNLRLCNDIPLGKGLDERNCTTIFDTLYPLDNPSPVIVMNSIRFNGPEVQVRGKDPSDTRSVNGTCSQSLLYAYQKIRDSTSEDLTFLILAFWLLAISVLAVTGDSVAHLGTVMATRTLITAWSCYTIWRTAYYFKIQFQKLYATPGTPCQIDFFSIYLSRRMAYEIPNLVLNVAGMIITCWLSWDLWRMYNAQATRYVGAPQHINRLNKLFLAVLSCIQFEAFVLVSAMGLWIDALFNTAIRTISSHTGLYMGGFISTTIVLVPWIMLGWYGIRREMKKTIAVFFFLAFLIIAGWSIMFYSKVYRWTFLYWPLLAILSSTSYILLISSTILAIICRLNFDKGLKQYLHAEAALAKSGFSPEVFRHDEEKNTPLDIDGPSYLKETISPISPDYQQQPMPTYHAPTLSRSNGQGELQTTAQGAPVRVPRLAERPTSLHGPAKYAVRFGESF